MKRIRLAVLLASCLSTSCAMLIRSDYWTVEDARTVHQSCTQLLRSARAWHVAGHTPIGAKAVSRVAWDDNQLLLCTLDRGMRAVSAGPLVPIFPYPDSWEPESAETELGIVVYNRPDSEAFEFEPSGFRLFADNDELRLRAVMLGDWRCPESAGAVPQAVTLEPEELATLCFDTPMDLPEVIRLEPGPDREELRLERKRGTFFLFLE